MGTNNTDPLQKLQILRMEGIMNFGKIGYDIHYNLNSPTDNITNQNCPAVFELTPNYPSRGYNDYSLSIWVWKNIPKNFKDIVFFHELKEAECMITDRMDKTDAHKRAYIYYTNYAQKFLDNHSFNDFINWQSQFKCYNLNKERQII